MSVKRYNCWPDKGVLGDYVLLADHDAEVARAVEAEREACLATIKEVRDRFAYKQPEQIAINAVTERMSSAWKTEVRLNASEQEWDVPHGLKVLAAELFNEDSTPWKMLYAGAAEIERLRARIADYRRIEKTINESINIKIDEVAREALRGGGGK